MITVPAYRFAVSEALRHKRRTLDARSEPLCRPFRVWQLVDACFHACYLDFYGVLKKNALIMGEDHLMNAIAAFVLGQQGKSVLIVDDEVNVDHRIVGRYDMTFAGMEELICEVLAVERDPGKPLLDQLTNLCRGLLDDQGQTLVHQLDQGTLMHDQSTEAGHSFWAEPAQESIYKIGVETLRFWPREKLNVFGTEIGKCPQFRAEFDSIILTSASQYTRLTNNQIPIVAVGDALKPLEQFDFYRASDRLREILDTIRVLRNVQDVSPPDQHDSRL